MRHLMSPLDFTVEELDEILDLADDIEANPEKYAHACDGKKLATYSTNRALEQDLVTKPQC